MGTKRDELKDGVLSRVKPDEPIFVLRAQDMMAPKMIEIWADHVLTMGGLANKAKIERARQVAREMRAWQRKNTKKVPD